MKTVKVQYEDIPHKGKNPILSYCRKLLKEGMDPNTRLEVYRGQKTEFDIAITNIGEGAKWSIQEDPKLLLIPYNDYWDARPNLK